MMLCNSAASSFWEVKMKVKVIYHDDIDGRASAHLVGICYKNVEFAPFHHGDINIDGTGADIVYIIDISIPPKQLAVLMEECAVVWIDHHKTAIENLPTHIPGIRRVGTAACELTWEYLFPFTDVPMYIKLIGDRDVWAWQYGDSTMYFSYGIHAEDTSPTSKIWDTVSKDCQPIISNGAAIYKYIRQQSLAVLKERSFLLEWRGYRTLAINSDLIKSAEFMKEFAPDVVIWMTFRMVAKRSWTVTIYSDTIDVSRIAVEYGGGGHKGAAGFQSADLLFLND
jgi:oligoribonuclease NrnB/cAMP/cGMP phosphodiesterase (DHH superfamily)